MCAVATTTITNHQHMYNRGKSFTSGKKVMVGLLWIKHKEDHIMRLEEIGIACSGSGYKIVTVHGKKCMIFLG